MNNIDKIKSFDETEWIPEMSSGHPGYRNKKTGEWIYSKADGYFLDDYPQSELYSEIIGLEKVLSGIICANPGTSPDKKVLSKSKAQIMVLHETNGYPNKKPLTTFKSCCIVFSGTDDKKLQDQKWDYGVVYKNKESSNPFKTLPINLK